MKSLVGLIVGILFSVAFSALTSDVQAQGRTPALPGLALPLPVDVDGDGLSTYGDKYVFNYYLERGGSLASLLRRADTGRGLIDLSSFFLSFSPERPAGEETTTAGLAAPGTGPLFRRGDANDDGVVNVSDPSFILNWNFSGGPAPTSQDSADANDDGQVTGQTTDANYLSNWLFSGGPAPPAPGPFNCGLDPTPDSLPAGFTTTCASSSCIDLSYSSLFPGSGAAAVEAEIDAAMRFEMTYSQPTFLYLFNRVENEESSSEKVVVLESYAKENGGYSFFYLRVRNGGQLVDAATNMHVLSGESGAAGVPLAGLPSTILETTVAMTSSISSLLSNLETSGPAPGVGGHNLAVDGSTDFLSYKSSSACIQQALYGYGYSYTQISADPVPSGSDGSRFHQIGFAFDLWALIFGGGPVAHAAQDGNSLPTSGGLYIPFNSGDSTFKQTLLAALSEISPCYIYTFEGPKCKVKCTPVANFCDCFCDNPAGTNIMDALCESGPPIVIRRTSRKPQFKPTKQNGIPVGVLYIRKDGYPIKDGGPECNEEISLPLKIELAHEMVHAIQWQEMEYCEEIHCDNIPETDNNNNEILDREEGAVRGENQVRAEVAQRDPSCDLGQRLCYGGLLVENPGVPVISTDGSGFGCTCP